MSNQNYIYDPPTNSIKKIYTIISENIMNKIKKQPLIEQEIDRK